MDAGDKQPPVNSNFGLMLNERRELLTTQFKLHEL